MGFADVARATQLPVDQVELLLMRAMSRGLIKGQIDEIDTLESSTDLKTEPLRPGRRCLVEASSSQQERHEEDEEALLSAGRAKTKARLKTTLERLLKTFL